MASSLYGLTRGLRGRPAIPCSACPRSQPSLKARYSRFPFFHRSRQFLDEGVARRSFGMNALQQGQSFLGGCFDLTDAGVGFRPDGVRLGLTRS